MLTPQDIKKITQAQIAAQKHIFFTKKEIYAIFLTKAEFNEKFSKLQGSMDKIVKMFSDNSQEVKVFGHRVDRLENWAKPAGEKIGLKFET